MIEPKRELMGAGVMFSAIFLAGSVAGGILAWAFARARQFSSDDSSAESTEGSATRGGWKWRPVTYAKPRRNPGALLPAPIVEPPKPRAELPPLDLLAATPAPTPPDSGPLDVIGYRLTGALRSLKFDGLLVGRTTGPAVTRFEVDPAPGLKLRDLAHIGNDLAGAMKVSSVRIVAPIPGKGTVGVEVPNPIAEPVAFKAMAELAAFESAAHTMPLLLGRDLSGRPIIADLAKMPHLLIAGAADSGKSMCLNTFVASLVYRHSPATLRFLMVEHGESGLSQWNGLPHMRHPVVHDTARAVSLIEWAALEMEERARALVTAGARNVRDFNERVPHKALPYIVLAIDEIADLMLSDEGVEGPLAMLAQRGRSAGIHVILTTERPNANVVTSLLKGNFPSRIALRLTSALDSRRLLDGIGAESLIGQGDMLFVAPGKSDPARIQGTFLSDDERARLIGWFSDPRRGAANGWLETAANSEADVVEQLRAREVQPASR